ncbi:2-methylisocitrate lyase-like PEP mutase family enzyme [Isoptericola sp. CG 20/1183]|uniref:2-methylisocitrate lyase-like PEP mutase family enzyme n=1 Tax=Isoptericola halotolerans TaxID=300560 RepID=A0ABX5EG42_9MICO|nr:MULTISPECIES: isocitrate lyase/phosphoenolpyruvate mutase family protein [Isoptericola]PRZ08311.1 2-methylisocitrate lyase-like PEP mutase family enzyme [Isoptericola halotolerans]PRZ09108.1 2-methylisocitrate lyase-like PEP mutase family enzyme [Isoptericola sp. CG 20/1183]
MHTVEKAEALKALHEAPEILRVVNVWDAISTRTVADLPGTRAIATAGHSIAASHGFADGEIPFDVALSAVARIVAATDLPVTADLDAGFGDPGESVRRAIGVGVVGANVEDRLVPLTEAVANVEAIVRVAEQEGVPFQLNARTDALVRGGERPLSASLDDAVERGRAFLDAGASLVFVPGVLDRESTQRLVAGLGERRLSVIGLPGALTAAEYESLGVARVSYGPLTQRVALRALRDLATDLYGDGVIPEDTPALN